MKNTALTPYDTGARCEAHVWIPGDTPVSESCPAENFGKADFDDEEGWTVVTIWVEKSNDGTHCVKIEEHCSPDEITVASFQHPENPVPDAAPVSTTAMELVYRNEAGSEHTQPWGELTDVGTLIDPDTGDDMELIGWRAL